MYYNCIIVAENYKEIFFYYKWIIILYKNNIEKRYIITNNKYHYCYMRIYELKTERTFNYICNYIVSF